MIVNMIRSTDHHMHANPAAAPRAGNGGQAGAKVDTQLHFRPPPSAILGPGQHGPPFFRPARFTSHKSTLVTGGSCLLDLSRHFLFVVQIIIFFCFTFFTCVHAISLLVS